MGGRNAHLDRTERLFYNRMLSLQIEVGIRAVDIRGGERWALCVCLELELSSEHNTARPRPIEHAEFGVKHCSVTRKSWG